MLGRNVASMNSMARIDRTLLCTATPMPMRTMYTTTMNRAQYQYSDRGARPSKLTYFEKHVVIASWIPMAILLFFLNRPIRFFPWRHHDIIALSPVNGFHEKCLTAYY